MDKSMAVYNHLVSFGSKPLGTWSLLGVFDVGVFSVFGALDALDALEALFLLFYVAFEFLEVFVLFFVT